MKAFALSGIAMFLIMAGINYGAAIGGDQLGMLRGTNSMQWAAITYLLFRRWIAPKGERP